ncbi:MAG: cytochrome c oxidase assembly protein [Dehalococcoidia bacterium]|nr:MAG: cytochrome c oxidase assembly protein [Dehalococcoidia bacterium]
MAITAFPTSLPAWAPHDVINESTRWWLAWNFDLQFLIPLALVGYWYARGLRRWPDRSRAHSRWRTASYYSGLAMLALAFESPLDRLGEHQFSMHMVQHSIVMMFVPPLILLGAPTTPMLRGMPRWLRQRVVRHVVSNGVVRAVWGFLTYPIVTMALFVVLQWGWHLMPGWYDRALNDDFIHQVQHGSFLAVAMLFWWNIIDPKPLHSRIPVMARILYFYGAMIPKHILAAFIVFADAPFYPTYERVHRFLPLTPMEDQQLAGVLLWVPFGELLNLLTAGIILGFWFKRGNAEQKAKEDAEDALVAAQAASRTAESTAG